jgi:hypothetical protein
MGKMDDLQAQFADLANVPERNGARLGSLDTRKCATFEDCSSLRMAPVRIKTVQPARLNQLAVAGLS